GLAPPAPCRSPGAPVSKRARAKNAQNCFLYWLLPTVVASAIGFLIDEIEMEFLQENSAWEFSHSLGQFQTLDRDLARSVPPPITDMGPGRQCRSGRTVTVPRVGPRRRGP